MILKSVIRDIHVRRKWRDSSIQSLFKFSLVKLVVLCVSLARALHVYSTPYMTTL